MLKVNMSHVFNQFANAKRLLFIVVLLVMVSGCASPGALIPGQINLHAKDMPLTIFTLHISNFPTLVRIEIELLNNTTNDRKYHQLWQNLTRSQYQQDYHNQIITLNLKPGKYTIDKFVLVTSNSYITIMTHKQFTVKDGTVSYIGNIHFIHGGFADNDLKRFAMLALTGREKIYIHAWCYDNYKTDIIKIKRVFPCLRDIKIENQCDGLSKHFLSVDG